MDKVIEQMGQDLARAEYGKLTRDRYIQTATELSKRFGKPLSEVSRDELRTFVDELTATKGASTVEYKMCALLFLYRRTLGRPQEVSFIKLPKRHSRVPDVLSQREVDALIRAIRKPRYQALAMVLYGAGLRLSEALALEVGDIEGARGVIVVRKGKGNKGREAKLSQTLYVWLRKYWDRERPALPYLFADRKGRRPTPLTIRQAFALAAKEAKIKKRVTPHVLRHSFATHLLEQGTDFHVVGALLGHASLSSTARYARVTQKLVRQTPSPLDLLPYRYR